MAIPLYPPRQDAGVLSWGQNFLTKITPAPATMGLLPAQVTAFGALVTAYASAYATAIEPSTNSKANITAKNVAREALMTGPGGAKQLVGIVQAFPGTTDFMRAELAIRIRDVEPSPIDKPTESPSLSIDEEEVFGRTIPVRLRDKKSPDSRKKPAGVQGASVFYQIGDTLTANWVFSGNTNRTTYLLDIPDTVPEGETVWITANWFNPAKDTGPAATPIFTKVQYGGAAMAA